MTSSDTLRGNTVNDAIANAKSSLASALLEAYKFQYDDYCNWWDSIERKAQGTVAIAGIVIAGTFAFVRQLDSSTPQFEKWLLSAIVIALFLSIGLSVVALFVREFSLPPDAENIEELTRELMKIPDPAELPDRVVGIIYDEAPVWKDCTRSLYRACRLKAGFVTFAQLALLVAALLIVIVTLSEIF